MATPFVDAMLPDCQLTWVGEDERRGVGTGRYGRTVPYTAQVLRVMICSPSDTVEARDAVERAIHDWNHAHGRTRHALLQPWRWETSSVPVLGDHPQSLINRQGVDDSDLVIALFGSRLGSPTPDAVSGTVAEIERAVEQGKPVHLYFSTAPLPHDVDTAQLDGLRAFKAEIADRGLFGEFANVTQLGVEVWKAIEFDLSQLAAGPAEQAAAPAEVRFLAQPGQERELRGHDRRGKPQYRTRTWVDVTNTGAQDAHGVRFSTPEGSPLRLAIDGEPTVIHGGQTRRVPTIRLAGEGAMILQISWTENGEEQHRELHVG
jgi:hypothetical protein